MIMKFKYVKSCLACMEWLLCRSLSSGRERKTKDLPCVASGISQASWRDRKLGRCVWEQVSVAVWGQVRAHTGSSG